MKFIVIFAILIPLFTCFSSCKKADKQSFVSHDKELVEELIGNKFIAPSYGIDTVNICDSKTVRTSTDFEIIMYVDSTACTTCNIDFYLWNRLIKNAEATYPHKISFSFYCQTKKDGAESIINFIKRYRFNNPVYLDSLNLCGSLNKFVNKCNVICLLLNKDKEIIAIGNPTKRAKIWNYYKSLISNN